MSEGMRVVECNNFDCKHVFEIKEDKIKLTQQSRCILHNKLVCPKCGKKAGYVYEHELRKERQEEDIKKWNAPLACLVCHSTQLHSSEKGFSASKAFVGGVAIGGLGLLAGFHGSKKVMLTCLECGKQWEAGSLNK